MLGNVLRPSPLSTSAAISPLRLFQHARGVAICPDAKWIRSVNLQQVGELFENQRDVVIMHGNLLVNGFSHRPSVRSLYNVNKFIDFVVHRISANFLFHKDHLGKGLFS